MSNIQYLNLPKGNPEKMKQLTPRRRELMLKVMDDCPDLKNLMWLWNNHRQQARLEEVLTWLISNRMTGKNLMDYLKQNPGSFNKLFAMILNKLGAYS